MGTLIYASWMKLEDSKLKKQVTRQQILYDSISISVLAFYLLKEKRFTEKRFTWLTVLEVSVNDTGTFRSIEPCHVGA
jgi:hypothetical protein